MSDRKMWQLLPIVWLTVVILGLSCGPPAHGTSADSPVEEAVSVDQINAGGRALTRVTLKNGDRCYLMASGGSGTALSCVAGG